MLLIINVFFIGAKNVSATDNKLMKKEAVAEEYIKVLADKDYQKAITLLPISSIGEDVNNNSTLMTLEQAESLNDIQEMDTEEKEQKAEGVMESQFNQVISSFGEDAWDNVNYLISNVEHMDGKTGYVNKLTNKPVKEEEYNSLNKQYWERIAKENGISYEKLFDFHNLNLDDATRHKYQSIIMKNWDGMPAESRIFTDYELCQVNLKFNGKDSGTDHLNNFKFYISNETGQWNVCQGLTWDYPEYDSDIVEIDH